MGSPFRLVANFTFSHTCIIVINLYKYKKITDFQYVSAFTDIYCRHVRTELVLLP